MRKMKLVSALLCAVVVGACGGRQAPAPAATPTAGDVNAIAKLEMSCDEVGVQVRQKDMPDAQAMF